MRTLRQIRNLLEARRKQEDAELKRLEAEAVEQSKIEEAEKKAAVKHNFEKEMAQITAGAEKAKAEEKTTELQLKLALQKAKEENKKAADAAKAQKQADKEAKAKSKGKGKRDRSRSPIKLFGLDLPAREA